MAKVFELEIYTPEREFFNGEVTSLVAPLSTGDIGIMADFEPVAALLISGVIKIQSKNKWMQAAVTDGFIKAVNNKVTILTEAAFWPHEVAGSVEEELEALENDVKKARSQQEYKMAKAQLAIHFAKLKIKKRDT